MILYIFFGFVLFCFVFFFGIHRRPSLAGKMETINITNELLREENVALRKDISALEESKSVLQAALSDYELQCEQLQRQIQDREESIAQLKATPPTTRAAVERDDAAMIQSDVKSAGEIADLTYAIIPNMCAK